MTVYPINPETKINIPPGKLLNIIIIIPKPTNNSQFMGTGLPGLRTLSKIITARTIEITIIIALEVSK